MNKINKSSGFTLIELLVVLAILGMIAGLVGPRIMKQLGTAKSNTTKLQIEDLGAGLDIYYLDNGRYPNTEEGINALVQKPSGFDNWNGPYLKKNNVFISQSKWRRFEARPKKRVRKKQTRF